MQAADEAMLVGPAPARESYLNVAERPAAARGNRRDGDPSGLRLPVGERRFAEAVLDAGLAWIGPSPETIRDMGDKERARADRDGSRRSRCSRKPAFRGRGSMETSSKPRAGSATRSS